MLFERAHVAGIVAWIHGARSRFSQVKQDNYVDAFAWRIGAQKAADLNVESGLLINFSYSRFFGALARFYKPTRQAPIIDERFEFALD